MRLHPSTAFHLRLFFGESVFGCNYFNVIKFRILVSMRPRDSIFRGRGGKKNQLQNVAYWKLCSGLWCIVRLEETERLQGSFGEMMCIQTDTVVKWGTEY